MAIDFKAVEKLIQLAKKNKLSELEVEDGKNRYRVQTALGAGFRASTQVVSAAAVEAPSLADSSKMAVASPRNDDRYVKVTSPFVGTFYRAPSPEADSYVAEGQMVKKGDVLCIIEAMKLMNEIESECAGRVVSILTENGQPVEYGEPLFLIDPI